MQSIVIDVKVIELSGLLVVEVARSAAEDHISLTMSLDSLTSISISKVLSVSILDQDLKAAASAADSFQKCKVGEHYVVALPPRRGVISVIGKRER